MALAYLLSVVTGVLVLAVAMRRRPAPAAPPSAPAPAPAAVAVDAGTEIRAILTAATQLAAKLAQAA